MKYRVIFHEEKHRDEVLKGGVNEEISIEKWPKFHG
jgi:hypothetical protein